MKTCSQCGMLFEEDDVSEPGPLEEMTDMFLGSADSSRDAQLCPRCKEELAMMFIAGFGM